MVVAGVIVYFYFGVRHQVKSQEFQRSIVDTVQHVPQVIENIAMIGALRATSVGVADAGSDARLSAQAIKVDDNPALRAWLSAR